MDTRLAASLAVALGIGLLIGAERERRKETSHPRATAGIRTFAFASLVGALAQALGGVIALSATLVVVGGLAALGYWRNAEEDPGLTTELALVGTVLLGALAIAQPALAAGIAVIAAILLSARRGLHRFVAQVLTTEEMWDALTFAAATLVVLPLLPTAPIDPFGVLVPRTVWELAVLVMAVSAAGYIALRAFGPRLGLPLAGVASGFVSGIATIGTMGARARRDDAMRRPAVAGAVMSNVSTVVQLAAVVLIADASLARALTLPLLLAGLAAAAYGAVFVLLDLRHASHAETTPGRAFDLWAALGLAVTVTLVLLASAALTDRFGIRVLTLGMTLAGFADTHSAAFSVASLARAGTIGAGAAVVPVVAAFSANTVTKAVVAFMYGGRSFALRVTPGLVLMVAAAWLGVAMRA